MPSLTGAVSNFLGKWRLCCCPLLGHGNAPQAGGASCTSRRVRQLPDPSASGSKRILRASSGARHCPLGAHRRPWSMVASSARVLFEKLADDFKFDCKIVDRFLELQLETPHDFRHYVTAEDEVEKAFIENLPQPRVQLARVRHAWASCVAEAKVGEVCMQTEAGRIEDEDAILPAAKLEQLKTRFWNRYHLCLTPAEWPSDRLLSRLAKAMDMRTLEVMDLWTVKSLLHQKSASGPKRRRITDNLWIQDDEDDAIPDGGHDLSAYFQRMRIYLHGLAVVGSAPLSTAPATAEVLGTPQTTKSLGTIINSWSVKLYGLWRSQWADLEHLPSQLARPNLASQGHETSRRNSTVCGVQPRHLSQSWP